MRNLTPLLSAPQVLSSTNRVKNDAEPKLSIVKNGGSYQKVFDGRKQRVRGLWQRNGRFYAQLTLTDAATGLEKVGRQLLEGATTVPQAIAEMQKLKAKRDSGDLVVLKKSPLLSSFIATYIGHVSKRESTMKGEKIILDQWVQMIGDLPLNQITASHIHAYRAARKKEVSGRTINLGLTILRNLLNHARDLGYLSKLPTDGIKHIRHKAKRKEIPTPDQIDKLCAAAIANCENGTQFADYIRFLAYTGARKTEALSVRWDDIDFDGKRVRIGWDNETKNGGDRYVDFNPKLEAHLMAMRERRNANSCWLFATPWDSKQPWKTFIETLRTARESSNLTMFSGFHVLRHYFVSMSVMAGIDYLTIARWVGHQDGGILIGKVYGHLSNDHGIKQAAKLTL